MDKIWSCILALALAWPACAAERFDIAITVDDLPAHGKLPPGMTRLGIAGSYLETLKAHGVPEAYGFVNAKKIADEPGSEAVLDAWRSAGYPLGNHTFSHTNLTKAASLKAWEADVIAGEPEVARRMQGADWHYLRFPNLSAGSDAQRTDGARAFLKSRGYRVADVSVAFGDWVYTDAYVRCVAKGDSQAIAAMKAHYLKAVDRGIASMKAASQQVYGRLIPQVLLTHLGGWSAVTMPDVLARLDAAGARYVTLAQAQADPAYQEFGGGSVVARTARKKGIKIVNEEGDDEPGFAVKELCR
jgi:peptidoglycan/xylan/chitin deacetylase (PgdA/CDA1 family)